MSNRLSILGNTAYTMDCTVQHIGSGRTMSLLVTFLRAKMDEHHLDQKQLAAKAEISESTLSNIFTKPGVIPRPDTLRGLAEALEVDAATLTALVGYATEHSPAVNDRVAHFAQLIQAAPWIESGFEKWLQLPEDEQQAILDQIEFRLHRRRKDRK